MAKLSVAYALCPLIDDHSLLGVSADVEAGCVIATIGKNIVIRYKLENQRQVGSWSSKNKLTCPVIFDTSSFQYVAVFGNDQLRMWKTDDRLDSVPRYKFLSSIHCLIPDEQSPIVLFRNGHVVQLSLALSSRKEIKKPVLKPGEEIKDYCVLTSCEIKYVAIVSSTKKDDLYLNIVSVSGREKPLKFKISHKDDGGSLVGHCVLTKDNTWVLLTLWSDGSLYSLKFLPTREGSFPGTFLQKVMLVNAQCPVAMTPISSRSIALFGADPNDEGARLVLLNLEFQVVEARLHFKLFTNPPKFWNVRDHLLVALGTNLIAVPYHVEKELLSTLLGAHCSSVAVTAEQWFGGHKKTKYVDNGAPSNIEEKIKNLRLQGQSQGVILKDILPSIIEKKDTESLVWCLQNFTDFPESCLVQMLKFCLLEPPSVFYHIPKKQNGISVSENEVERDMTSVDFVPLKPEGRSVLVNRVLNIPFCSVPLVPHLRRIPLNVVMDLFKHLCFLLENNSTVAPLRVVEWLCLLLDSHYQEYLLSKDEKMEAILTKLQEVVCSQVTSIQDFATLGPMLYRIRSGKVPLKISESNSKKYSIETLKL